MLTNEQIHQRLNDLAQLISQNECERKRLNRENEQLRKELAEKDATILKLRRVIRLKCAPQPVPGLVSDAEPEPTI